MTTKTAQTLLAYPADPGQILGRMRQIAADMRWSKETSPALAFMEANVSGEPVSKELRAAALQDAVNYSEDAGTRFGLSPRSMKGLMELIRGVQASAGTSNILKIAKRFHDYLSKK